MVAKTSKQSACPICGNAIARSGSICPECGVKFDKKMNPVCPMCNTPLRPGVPKCDSCGTNLKEMIVENGKKTMKDEFAILIDELITDTVKEVKAQDKRFSCPKCDVLLAGNEERCPSCNAWLTGKDGYQCPVCGAGVNPLMMRCPHCGTLFIEGEEDTKPPEPAVPAEEAECPRCGKVVSMSNSHCPHCGVEFKAEEATGRTSLEAEEEVLCPVCRKPVDGHTPSCPYCGAEFEGEEIEESSAEAPEVVPEQAEADCPSCGKPVSLTASVCPHCGVEFEPEEEVIPEVPEKAIPAELTPAPKFEAILTLLVRPVDLKVIIGFTVFGSVLLVLAYLSQLDINNLGVPGSPLDERKLAILEGQRNVYLLTAVASLFLALFGASLSPERIVPVDVLRDQMLSTARTAGDYCASCSLRGNAFYLPPRNGLTRERVFVPRSSNLEPPKEGLSDALSALSSGDGGNEAMLLEPLGLSLLDHVEKESGRKISDAGLEGLEGSLQMLKHDFGILKDFHFKARRDTTVLRVEYSGLAEACKTVRNERPDTCRQVSCFGCSCMLSAAARATGKMVQVEEVDNAQERVEFTISLHDW